MSTITLYVAAGLCGLCLLAVLVERRGGVPRRVQRPLSSGRQLAAAETALRGILYVPLSWTRSPIRRQWALGLARANLELLEVVSPALGGLPAVQPELTELRSNLDDVLEGLRESSNGTPAVS